MSMKPSSPPRKSDPARAKQSSGRVPRFSKDVDSPNSRKGSTARSRLSTGDSATGDSPERRSSATSRTSSKQGGLLGAGDGTGSMGIGSVNMSKMASSRSTKSITEDKDKMPIIVTVRVRPALKDEDPADDAVTCSPDGKTLCLENRDNGQSKTVTVDEVIDSRKDEGSQEEFFDRVGRTFVISAMKDYNCCIFAYGHTGSGKTHTMLGHGGVDGPGAGLLPRVIREIFMEHAKLPSMLNAQYSCEFYEVYNETIRDLLAPTHVQGTDRKRTVHVHPKHGVRIDGLSTSVVTDTAQTLELVLFGNQMRTVAATTMNAQSSRSHAIFTFRFEAHESSVDHHESVMTFVDLAGREDQAASQNKEMQFREMTYINTSLFHLSHVITKLSDGTLKKGSLADFRNSKLTLLLSQALVGNCCTALLATLAPSNTYFEDSLSTINFARQVKQIKTRPMINNKKTGVVVSELENELEKLRKDLQSEKKSNTEVEQELLAAQALIKHLKGGNADMQASSADAAKMRHRVSTKLGLKSFGALGDAVPKARSGEPLPFLTKLSNDASLQGCCNYFLTKPSTRMGSLEVGCDVILQGVGIRPLMCLVDYHEDEKLVTVELPPEFAGACKIIKETDDSTEDDAGSEEWGEGAVDSEEDVPRVLVNGHVVKAGCEAQTLNHGDCIILGYGHAYRLVVPTIFDVAMDAQTMARKKLDNMEVSVAMEEVQDDASKQFHDVMLFMRRVFVGVAEGQMQAAKKAMGAVCPMIDEANQITIDIFGEKTLSFKLHMMADPFVFGTAPPHMAVCVIADSQANKNVKRENGKGAPDGLAELARKTAARGSLVPFANTPISDSLGLSEQTAESEDQLLYVWTVEKFIRRLSEMRDLYQGGTDANDGFAATRAEMRADPYKNPWREPVFADVRLLSEKARDPSKAARFEITQPTVEEGSPKSAVPSLVSPVQQLIAEINSPTMPPAAEEYSTGAVESVAISYPEDVSETLVAEDLQYSPDGDLSVSKGDAYSGLEAFINGDSEEIPPGYAEASFQNAPEVDRLRAELAACRKNPEQSPDDLTKLLDRLEGLVDHLDSTAVASPPGHHAVANQQFVQRKPSGGYANLVRPIPQTYQYSNMVATTRPISPRLARPISPRQTLSVPVGVSYAQPRYTQQPDMGSMPGSRMTSGTMLRVRERSPSPTPICSPAAPVHYAAPSPAFPVQYVSASPAVPVHYVSSAGSFTTTTEDPARFLGVSVSASAEASANLVASDQVTPRQISAPLQYAPEWERTGASDVQFVTLDAQGQVMDSHDPRRGSPPGYPGYQATSLASLAFSPPRTAVHSDYPTAVVPPGAAFATPRTVEQWPQQMPGNVFIERIA